MSLSLTILGWQFFLVFAFDFQSKSIRRKKAFHSNNLLTSPKYLIDECFLFIRKVSFIESFTLAKAFNIDDGKKNCMHPPVKVVLKDDFEF